MTTRCIFSVRITNKKEDELSRAGIPLVRSGCHLDSTDKCEISNLYFSVNFFRKYIRGRNQGQKFHFALDFFLNCHIMEYVISNGGVWLSLVERTTGGREAAGSSTVTPMIKVLVLQGLLFFCVAFYVVNNWFRRL